MSALKALIVVMIMHLATTVKEVTSALVTLDTQGMDFLVWVSAAITTIRLSYLHLLS